MGEILWEAWDAVVKDNRGSVPVQKQLQVFHHHPATTAASDVASQLRNKQIIYVSTNNIEISTVRCLSTSGRYK